MKSLNPNKATTYINISTKILRQTAEATADTCNYILVMLCQTGEFPTNLKLADLTLKKEKDLLKRTINLSACSFQRQTF